MRYFFIERLETVDPDYYFTDKRTKGLGISTWQTAEGVSMAERWPTPPPTLLPCDDTKATKLPDLVGSTVGYLIVSSRLRAVIEAHCAGVAIEYLPVILHSHKNKPMSADYCLINPLGQIDCLNHARSQIVYTEERQVVGVDKFVLDPRQLKGAQALFCIKEDPRQYVINETLARAFVPHNFTNLLIKEIEVSDSDKAG
jgi:hypothetical protein